MSTSTAKLVSLEDLAALDGVEIVQLCKLRFPFGDLKAGLGSRVEVASVQISDWALKGLAAFATGSLES